MAGHRTAVVVVAMALAVAAGLARGSCMGSLSAGGHLRIGTVAGPAETMPTPNAAPCLARGRPGSRLTLSATVVFHWLGSKTTWT
jgi:hypothetical protein